MGCFALILFANIETLSTDYSSAADVWSLAKSFPIDIAEEFRTQINDISSRCLTPMPGDMITLVAIGTVFPPSDAFHQVTTPAMLLITRFLSQKIPKNTMDYVQGTFMGSLALHYVQLSQRFCPEFMNFCLNTLVSLAPIKSGEKLGSFPQHEPAVGIRVNGARKVEVKKLEPTACFSPPGSEKEDLSTKVAVMNTTLQLLDAASQLYAGKSSFTETFEPVKRVLRHLSKSSCTSQLPPALTERITKLQGKLKTMLTMAKLARRPLELHHHRPLA